MTNDDNFYYENNDNYYYYYYNFQRQDAVEMLCWMGSMKLYESRGASNDMVPKVQIQFDGPRTSSQ